ncbi:restriction endonuclease subunit S [Bifidobacterium catenulatum]|uniref:Restriction endonuclease subunit S n=1 Tax=Bifidobacterium catenulatum TaxID=1686 RepID=A0A1V8PQ23_9BIFI|nr:restriction endonuclease subunit S [Bifidobacterium catenulatum]OQM50720.1 restriction endonuclease subunit S [Bifidobacterium catenulatum]
MVEQHEKTLVPQIRFAGFTDPWEQRKLGDELEFLRNNTLSRAELSESEGTAFDIHYGDVLIKYGSVLNLEKAKVPRIMDSAIADRQTCDRLQDGDVIIADTAEDSAVGKCTELCNSKGKMVFSGLHTMPLRPMGEYASGYLGHYLNSSAFHSQLLPLMQGIKVISISRSAMADTTMTVPSVDEQRRIGAFFDRLDSLITLHQRKYDKLCVLKKSMLDKMFPKGGSLYPEIRFAGFTDPWEQRKLGELYKEVSEKNDLTYGKDRIISVAHMYFNPVVYVTEDDYLKTYNVMRLGDIAFEGNRSKNFAHGRLVENTIGDGIVSHVFKVFRPIQPFDLMYWKYSINNEKAMKDVLTRSTKASTMMHELVAKDFLNEEIAVPSLEEQRQIGGFFDRLDSLITLHQRKLELLRNIKKSMLDKMFV